MAGSIGISFLIGATLGSSVGAAFSSLQDRIRATQQSFRTASGQSRQMSAAAAARQRRDDAAARASEQMRTTGHVDDSLRRELRELNRAYAEAARRAGVYGRSLDEINRRQQELARSVETTQARLQRLQALQGQRDLRSEIISQMRSTLAPAAAAAVAMPVKLAIDFESAMADVKKVTDFDAPGFEKFNRDILDLSARLPMAADGLAAIAAAAGQSGIAQEELLTFTEDAAKMGVAFDISAAEAGSAMTGLRNNFKLAQDGVRLLGDSMNALANSMDARASDIVNFANRAGGTAKVYGFTGQEVAALGAAFLDCKVGAEEASTATNSMLTKLGTASILPDRAKDAITSLGLSAKGLEKAFKDDAQGALLSFLQTVKKSRDPMMALSEIFGAEHAPKIVRLMNNLEHYEQALKTVSGKENYAGSMQDEYAVRAETTANNIQLLKNTVSKLGITVGSVLLPPLNETLGIVSPLISGIADFAKRNEWLTQTVALAGGGFVVFRLGALVFKYTLSGLRTGCIQTGGALRTVDGAARSAGRAFLIPWNIGAKVTAIGRGCNVIRQRLVSVGSQARATAMRMRQLGFAGTMAGVGAGGIRMLGAAGRMAAGGVRALGSAFRIAFGPVSLLMTALSFGVDYVMEHWETIGLCFTGLWDSVKGIFTSALQWLKEKLAFFAEIGEVIANPIKSGIGKIKALWNRFTGGGKEAENSPAAALPQPAGNAAPEAAAVAAPRNAGEFLPVSPEAASPKPQAQKAAPRPAGEAMPAKAETAERKSPVKSEKAAKFEQFMAENQAEFESAPEKGAKRAESPKKAKNQPAGRAAPAAPSEPQIVQPQVQVQLSVTQNGIPEQSFASGVINALKARQADLEAMISGIVNEQARLSYGG